VRLIAVTIRFRCRTKPELPIFADAVPGTTRALVRIRRAAGVPRDIIRKLNEEINRAMKTP